jgi:predicted amino acid dehydrogenase
MIDKSRFCNNFSEYFTSTFGNGELAAAAGLKTLSIIETDSLAEKAGVTGEKLKRRLLEIHDRYPDVISGVAGKGLMIAVAFSRECTRNNLILRVLFESEKAGYLFSAWMLNKHRIRIFPTLSAPDSLRLEPSAYFTETDSLKVCSAIEELCGIIREKKMYELFKFLMDDDPFSEETDHSIPEDYYSQVLEDPAEGSVRTAFIAHFAFPLKEMRMLVPDFVSASDTGLRILFNRLQVLMDNEPVKMLSMNLFGGRIHFSFWVIPLDSAGMEFLHKSGKRKHIVAKIQKAADLAAAEGAEVISLGGYNSIVTNNGLSLIEPKGTRVITGNTLTAAVSLTHLGDTIRRDKRFNKPNIIAVIGSTGNIGRVTTEMLSGQSDICSELILVSRSEKRQSSLLDEITGKHGSSVALRTTGNMHDIREADILIICSNTNDPIILPHHIDAGKPVLITDISVPSAVSPDVYRMENVIAIPFSSYVTLPQDKEAVISSYSPRGTVFCCAAESILLGLEPFPGKLKGRILPEELRMMTHLAEKHGFLRNIGSSGSFKNR